MKWKPLLFVSVAGAVALAPSLAWAQTAQEAPKPEEASAQSANPAAPADATQDSTDQTDANGSDIVVTGLRRSLQTSQAIKKTSDGIVDAIVAEDIGKLPDTFASSALQRVPGVNVTRGGGEAAGVTVRGLPDLTTTYNGRQIFTAEGRYVQIQDFPAGTVAALEVYKSGLANQIEGGIAGEVNVRGRKPFDFNGFELSGSFNEVLSQQSEGTVPNGNLLISDRWNTGIGEMGLLVNASYVGIDFLDSSREESVVIQTTNASNAPGQQAGLRFPDAQGNFLGYGDRWRPSINAAFQWRPTPELEIYADGLFQGFRSRDYNRWMFIPIFGTAAGDVQLSNITTIPGTNLVSTATVNAANRPDGFTGSFNGHTDTYQGGGGFNWKRDRLQVSGDVAYTDSKYTANLVNVDYLLNASPTRTVQFANPHDGGPSQTFVNYDITNPANMLSRGLYQELTVVSGSSWQARGDVSYEMGGFLKRIQAGFRYEDRKAGRDFGNSYFNNEGLRIPLTSIPGGNTVGVSLPGFTYNNVLPNVAYAAISRDGIRDNLPALRAFYGAPAGIVAFDPLQNFRANEKSYAGYAQVKYGFDLGDVVVDGLLGIRAVKTKTDITGFSFNNGAYEPTSAKNEYTDYLPNASARVAFNDKLQLRLAYTQTRTRPNFIDLRPNLALGQPVVIPPTDICYNDTTSATCVERRRRSANSGNPNLKPLTSDNYDLSLEYYFSKTGSFTAAVFRHDARGFLTNSVTRYTDPTYGPLIVNQPINLGKTRLQGAEVAFTTFLDIAGLPDWAKGFGVQANGTYIDAKGDQAPAIEAGYGGNRHLPFNGVSKWAYNLIALYEKPQFSARVAYNYRSDFIAYFGYEYLPFDPIPHPTIEKARGQLDGSLSVTPVPNITLAFDVANILGNPLRRYRAFDTAGQEYARQIVYIERSYSLGVRFRF